MITFPKGFDLEGNPTGVSIDSENEDLSFEVRHYNACKTRTT